MHGAKVKIMYLLIFNIFYVSLFIINIFFSVAHQPLLNQGLLIIEASWLHSDTPHSVQLLWTSGQPDAETSAWQHTTIKRDRHLCPWRYSNPHYQQTIGCRPNQRLIRPRGYYDWHTLYYYILYGPFYSLYYVCVCIYTHTHTHTHTFIQYMFWNHTCSYRSHHALAHQ
jgi:hypothetical protein